MTPIFFDSSSQTYSPYPISDLHHEDHLSNHQFLSPNSQSSSSNSLTTQLFLNSNVHDHNGIFDTQLLQSPQNQLEGGINFASQSYTDQSMNNDQRIGNNGEKGVEYSTWNKSDVNNMANNDQTPMKWMSSKMRVMLKMKKSDPVNLRFYTSSTREPTKVEDHKPPMEETDNSTNYYSTSSNNNILPIRVCSDCNTTKTPLWRSGPRGPKSLCNACGIRQRKARRAAAAAAAAAAENGNGSISVPIITQIKVTKTQHKDHKKISNGHITKYKKRQYNTTQHITITTPSSSPSPSPSPSPLPSPSSSSSVRKNCVEEFLVSLSKNLTCYRVFPQDEKEAAILLMALSCGYAHET
ncbi:uncharacterized protein [Rutidosis leptorrhynchoides]|uniref:uncharacterized protein n=1 Tax=Rutidosis leptorrhynchoides TaxID=125765 RepID=UPI003A9A346D